MVDSKTVKTQQLRNQPTILILESESSCPRNQWVLSLVPEDDISRSVWGVHAVDTPPQGNPRHGAAASADALKGGGRRSKGLALSAAALWRKLIVICDFLGFLSFLVDSKTIKTQHLRNQPIILILESESSCPRNQWVLSLGPL